MTQELTNPRMYVPGYVKAPGVPYALGKKYLAKLAYPGLPLLIGRDEFKRAHEAEQAAVEWKEQLQAEYETALEKMLAESSLPHAVEEGELTVTGEA